MRKEYQKPIVRSLRMTTVTTLLSGSYEGEKGEIIDEPGAQDDFSAKENGLGGLW